MIQNYRAAEKYVGTTRKSGRAQFAILENEGLKPTHDILEIGCGALHLAEPLLRYMKPGRYHGIDPNKWLRTAARSEDRYLDDLTRNGFFSSADDFDGEAAFNKKFDVIFAHSILSHVSDAQFDQFLAGVRKSLKPGGFCLASLRLGRDSNDQEWVYPGVSYYSANTVAIKGLANELLARHRPDIKAAYIEHCPAEIHDWYEFA